ncbi:hypothetical protein WJX72_010586 [[Myrmecia] bisecta]|uniref:NADH:flavin oxidoreductase/NADH oxidase N-terminal domain-containing protein n=1 Tax=[Myrmecia] bisecta TaxID=41462 RepID=A0AAW1P2N6_9CHLO
MVYPPLTRSRGIDTIPQPAAVKYYTQRATPGGLMITEGTSTAPRAQGYPHIPGIFTEEQVEAWKPIVNAVKDKGSVFFMQLWHTGRASHQEYQPNGEAPIGPSANRIKNGQVFISSGLADYPTARALDKAELPGIVNEYRTAARNALRAGFDGVEVHGANGYLIDQFLKDSVNERTDEYGGSIKNRCRFPLEIIRAVADEVGADRTGVRFTPFGGFLDANDADPIRLYTYLLEQLNDLGLAYVHLVEPRIQGHTINLDHDESKTSNAPLRKAYKGSMIAAGGYTFPAGNEAIESGHADLIAFGRLWLSNPDLPKRFGLGAPLNKYDRASFYIQDQVKGYTDYPFLEEVETNGKQPQHNPTALYHD